MMSFLPSTTGIYLEKGANFPQLNYMEHSTENDYLTTASLTDTTGSQSVHSCDGSESEWVDTDTSSIPARSSSHLKLRPGSCCEQSSHGSQTPVQQNQPNSADEQRQSLAEHRRLQQCQQSELEWQFKQKSSENIAKWDLQHNVKLSPTQMRKMHHDRTAELLLRTGLWEAHNKLDRIYGQLRGFNDVEVDDSFLGMWAEEKRMRLSAGRQDRRMSMSGSISTKKLPPGKGTEQELLSLVESGSIRAMSLLGRLYFRQKKFAKAHVLLKRCPEWDLEAQYRLGVMYFDGLETKPNYKNAVRCMSRVANADPKTSGIPEQVIRSAQYFLGTAYYGGFGVPGSEEKAVQWWRLASQYGRSNGNVQAQIALGLFYSDPWHKDVKEAFFWHQCADRNGGSASTAPYAVMCQQGLGTKKQPMQALFKLKEAVLKYGSIYAAGNIIAFYFQRKLFKLAAHIATNLLKREHGMERLYSQVELKGLALAYFYLGRCHQLGLGVHKNEILAMRLFKQAVHMDIEIVHPLYFDWIYGLI